jgi:hypothetical protein
MRTGDAIATFADVIAVRETEKAVGCVPLGRAKLFWVPKGQLRNGNEVAHLGDQGALVVSEWWARTSRVHLSFEATE